MKTEPLLVRTFRLFDASPFTYRQIASRTGLDPNWLAKLKQRRIPEPGVTKIQRLHDFLAANPAATRVPKRSQNLRMAGNG